jgi:serine/threonine-protein kinase RsbT
MILSGGREIASIDLKSDRDVSRARRRVSEKMKELGARPLMQTRFVTAVSEIARNAVVHGGGGTLKVYTLPNRDLIGVECRDRGPGVASVEEALQEGFSTIGSMGRGLGGAKKLTRSFEIDSTAGKGTVVRLTGALKATR